jgi:hypothetical protein
MTRVTQTITVPLMYVLICVGPRPMKSAITRTTASAIACSISPSRG